MARLPRKRVIMVLALLCIVFFVVPVTYRTVNRATTPLHLDELLPSSSQELLQQAEESSWSRDGGSGSSGKDASNDDKKVSSSPNASSSPTKFKSETPVPDNAKHSTGGSRGLGIPSSATVLALPGMDFHLTNSMPTQFQGYFSKSPYKMNVIDYPRSASKTSISTGITNLDAALHSTSGNIIVLGYSQGAQVASGWMRDHVHDKGAPNADRLTFVLLGNPLRNGSGRGIGKLTWDGTLGLPTPTDTPWHIVDVARRYEGWADWPQDTSNQEAVDNADKGKSLFHKHYDEVNINATSHTIWNRGNTTFVLTQEDVLPIYAKESVSASQIATMRARVESGYHRY